MSPHPSLELLKHGLCALKETVKKCKDGLTARLRKKEKISEQVMEDSTDEEIFEAVQKMRNDRENMETNRVSQSSGFGAVLGSIMENGFEKCSHHNRVRTDPQF
jgi:hypothetical protein